MIRLLLVVRQGLGLALVLTALGGEALATNFTPEIDSGSMVSALTLLSSGLLLLTAKRRPK